MTAGPATLAGEAWALRHGDPAQAAELALKAKAQAEANGDEHALAESLVTLGFCQMRRANFKAAFDNASAACTLFERLQDYEGAQRALNTVGIIHGQTGNLTGALETFLKAHKLCEHLDDDEATANALNNLAIVYNSVGDYASALDYYLRSLNLYRRLGNGKGELRALQNVGNVYIELGRFEDALEHYLEGTALEGAQDDKHIYALTLLNIGRAYHRLNNIPKALTYLHQGAANLEGINAVADLSYALDELGAVYRVQNDLGKAIHYHERSLAIRQEVGDLKGESETHLHMGKLYMQEGNYEDALISLQSALEQATKVGTKASVYRAHQQMARAYQEQGNYIAAYHHLEDYTETREALFDEKFDQRFNALRVSFEVEQKEREKEIYRLRSVELAKANEELQRLHVALEEKSSELERQATQDALTQLYNRRYFDDKLKTAFEHAREHGETLSVMIGDIDNFKSVNDTFSHQIGDDVLVHVAYLLQNHVRDCDVVARYGGEEFVILLPQSSVSDAYGVCERVRVMIQNSSWHEIHPELSVTMSMGICDDLSLENGEKMVAKADDKLYEAKRNGKNQIKF